MHEFWIGTTNKGKLSEFKIFFDKHKIAFDFKSLSDLPVYIQPEENGKTFLENAMIKAKSLKSMKPGQWVMAEDSGLEVSALNNLPGIHTARYAGPKASDSENVAKLIKMMSLRAGSNRSARFVCCMVIFDPTGKEHVFNGELKGSIGTSPKGTGGFGYDPVFIPEGETQTLAEIGIAWKNMHSHRSHALEQFRQYLATLPAY